MDRRIAKMAALGRHFEVGNLYNYRNDIVVPGENFDCILFDFFVYSAYDEIRSEPHPLILVFKSK